MRRWLVENTNPDKRTGFLRDVLPGADVFIGVSAPNLLTGQDVAGMAAEAVVFALANPTAEIDPAEAQQHAAVMATGRSDYPRSTTSSRFPGFFRGLLDAARTDITDTMLMAAAQVIADQVAPRSSTPATPSPAS